MLISTEYMFASIRYIANPVDQGRLQEHTLMVCSIHVELHTKL